MKKNIISSVFISFVVSAFAQEPSKSNISSSFDYDKDFRIVASVEDIEISAKEFMMNYNFGPAFLKRQKDSKKRYLNLMINEKLLALEGYNENLHETDHVKNILSQIKADLMTEELFKEDVMGKVSVTDKEIEQAVQQDLKYVQIKWLFRKSFKKIKSDFNFLVAGFLFDSLFNNQFTDSILIDDRSMETSLFELSKKNPVLLSIIDTLKVGSFTQPIKIQDGYYIVKIDRGWSNVLLTETEWNEHNKKMKGALFKQKMDSLSDQYVNNLLHENNPQIKRPIFNLLRAWLAKTVLSKQLFKSWNFFENSDLKNGNDLDKIIHTRTVSELVDLNRGSVSLGDFISWYNPRKTYIKLSQISEEAFSTSVQNVIWRMLREKLLTERAISRGFQHHKNVVQQIRWWEDKTVYAKYKLELANSIEVTAEEVLEYYNKNKNVYRSKSGVYQPLNKVKTEIKNILHSEMYSTKLIHNVLAAKQKYNIMINDTILNEISVDTENDPRAIEVYTVKKGGLFPRQPYPTIDSEWKYWF